MNVADLILRQLAGYGVKYIFGVVGDAIFPLADAFTRQDRIQFIPATIETAASFMASASAKLTGQLGVCIATSGPGAANIANGVAGAYLDHVPLLCITGQVATAKLGTKTKQYINQTGFFDAITTRSALCAHPKAIIPMLNELINTAFTLKTAVHLAIPQDVFTQSINEEDISSIPNKVIFNSNINGFGNEDSSLHFLSESQRPLLIIGDICRNIAEDLYAFAKNYGAGIILSQESKGVIPDSDPLVLGGIGEAYTPHILAEADLFLLFGDAVYEDKYLSPKTKVMQFQNDSRAFPLNHPLIVADFNALLQKMKELFPFFLPRTEWRSRIESIHRERLEIAEHQSDSKHPARLFRHLAPHLREDALICLDVGEFVYWFDLAFLAARQQVLLSANWRSMGSGIPSGVAACLHFPGRQVISITGDGGFLMSMAELATVMRYKLPLIILVFQNKVYGLEKQKMSKEGFAALGTELALPDVLKIAEAFNLKGYCINDINDPSEIFKLSEAIKNPPALVMLEDFSAVLPSL